MPDPDPADFNRNIIEQFRANAGRVGAPFEGSPMILLHHVGAKSGTERVSPLVYQPVGDDFAQIFASKGGAPDDPQWFRNLVGHPETTVEVGSDTIAVRARVLDGPARDEIWTKQKELMPGFAEYEQSAKGHRVIPVVLLERVVA